MAGAKLGPGAATVPCGMPYVADTTAAAGDMLGRFPGKTAGLADGCGAGVRVRPGKLGRLIAGRGEPDSACGAGAMAGSSLGAIEGTGAAASTAAAGAIGTPPASAVSIAAAVMPGSNIGGCLLTSTAGPGAWLVPGKLGSSIC